MTYEEAVKAKSDKKNWCKHCLIVNKVKPENSPDACQLTCRLSEPWNGQYGDCDFEGEFNKCDKYESVETTIKTETITVKMAEARTNWNIIREPLGEITHENICKCSKEKLDELQGELQEQCNKAVKDLVKEYFKEHKD